LYENEAKLIRSDPITISIASSRVLRGPWHIGDLNVLPRYFYLFMSHQHFKDHITLVTENGVSYPPPFIILGKKVVRIQPLAVGNLAMSFPNMNY
jgi:hypothetical protein